MIVLVTIFIVVLILETVATVLQDVQKRCYKITCATLLHKNSHCRLSFDSYMQHLHILAYKYSVLNLEKNSQERIIHKRYYNVIDKTKKLE